MIVVFQPTAQWGGIDVAWASIKRQTLKKEIVFVVADEHYAVRRHIWAELNDTRECAAVIGYKQPDRPGYPKNLSSAYAYAINLARKMRAEMFVSMQDYFWIQPDGVERFLNYGRAMDPCLPTGLASITDNPPVESVIDPKGHYTIFSSPYIGKPEETFWWSDIPVRGMNETTGYYLSGAPQTWELNWCAISQTILMDEEIIFDPEFDRGIAFDHQAYAHLAIQKYGAHVIVDRENHALGLPHKLFFPEITEANGELVEANRQYLAERYGF